MLDGTWKWWHDKKVVRLEEELRESTFYKHVSNRIYQGSTFSMEEISDDDK